MTGSASSTEQGPGVPGMRARETSETQLRADTARTAAAQRLARHATGHPALERLAESAASALGVGSAQVSLLDDEQVVAACAGPLADPAGTRTPLRETLCATAAAPGPVAGRPLVVPDAAADARFARSVPVASGQVRSYLGVPLTTSEGHTVGVLCVYEAHPRAWSEADVAVLQQFAAAAVAELELAELSAQYEADRLSWELATAAAGIGRFDWDLRSGRLGWDERLADMFGYDPDTFDHTIDAFTARVHPDDRARVAAALEASRDSCGEYDAEFRVVLPDGAVRWVHGRGRTLCDPDGAAARMLGAAYDTTDTHDAGMRVARVLEAMSAAFFSLDGEWRFSYVNTEAERVLGRRRDELLGGVVWDLFPAAVGSPFEDAYRGAVRSGRPTQFEAHHPAPLDAWYEVRAWPGPDGLSVYFLDITERRRAEEAAARAQTRQALLAEVSTQLTRTLDVRAAVARLARLVVPALGDWCIVTLVEEDGRLHDIGSWHAEPDRRPLVEDYARWRLAALTDSSFLARARSAGEPAVVPSGATAAISAVLAPGRARDLLARLAPESAVVLPLVARGRTVGFLTLFAGPGRPSLAEPEALRTAEEVASRAGLALDNARLYDRQRRLAEGLQRSLLTDPPEPDHVQVAVRYVPAAEAAEVGGDWYDAFLQPQGQTVLVIGDVVGHDITAVAAMGQLRGLLRGIAFHSGGGPAAVLSGLDAAVEGLQVATTATAVVARLEQTPAERAAGLGRVRWSSAGHPPPLVLHPDGAVELLGDDGPDLMLGIDPALPRTEAVEVLERGATVLLYTDGLVERRDQPLDHGLERLRSVVADLAGQTLEDLCDGVLARMLPDAQEDDVALVAVRLHPQDQPRPAEAG